MSLASEAPRYSRTIFRRLPSEITLRLYSRAEGDSTTVTYTNLSGYSFQCDAKAVADDQSPVPDKDVAVSFAYSVAIVTPQSDADKTGKLTLTLTASQTDDLELGVYVADLLARPSGGDWAQKVRLLLRVIDCVSDPT